MSNLCIAMKRNLKYLLENVLVVVQVAGVRMLQAVLGNNRRSTNAVGNEVLTEVEKSLGEGGDSLLASGRVAVSRPRQLSQGSSTGPDLAGDDSVVDLLTK